MPARTSPPSGPASWPDALTRIYPRCLARLLCLRAPDRHPAETIYDETSFPDTRRAGRPSKPSILQDTTRCLERCCFLSRLERTRHRAWLQPSNGPFVGRSWAHSGSYGAAARLVRRRRPAARTCRHLTDLLARRKRIAAMQFQSSSSGRAVRIRLALTCRMPSDS